MQYELEDLECMLNIKYQRKMINALLESDSGVGNWILNARFRLRSSLDASLAFNPQAEKEISEARLYLQQWLEDSNSSLRDAKLELFCHFEIAESLFHSDAYDRSLTYFKQAQTLLSQQEVLQSLLASAKSEILKHNLNLLSLPSSLPLGSLPRSTLLLPFLETRIQAFIDVLASDKSETQDYDFTSIDQLLTSLNTDKSHNNELFTRLLAYLEADLDNERLYYDFKLHLASLPTLAPISDQIREINITYQILSSHEAPNVSWLSGVRNLSALFDAILQRSNTFSGPLDIKNRFFSTLRLIYEQSLDERMRFQLEERLNLASDLSTSIENLKSRIQSYHSMEPQEYEKDDFMALTRSRNPETLRKASESFSAVRGEELTLGILDQRIKQCESKGDFTCSMVLHSTMKRKIRADQYWTEFMALLHTAPDATSDENIIVSSKHLLDEERYPDMEVAIRFLLFLINERSSKLFDDFGLLLERSAAPAFFRAFYENIKRIMDLWRVVSTIHPSLEVSSISDAFSAAAVHFEEFLSSEIKRASHQWTSLIIAQWRHTESLKILASILLFSLDFLYRASKLPCDALRIDRINKNLASLSLERDHRWVSQVKSVNLGSMNLLHSLLSSVLFALQRASPNDSSPPLCLGDLHLLQHQHETALRFYLRSIFAGQHEPGKSLDISRINQLIPSLILCFTHLRLYHYAIVLHQYVPNIDYKSALLLMSTWGAVFPRHLFAFVFDLPLLEILAHTLKNAGNLNDAHEIAGLIARPEHVALEFAPKTLNISKAKFVHYLAHQFLDYGNWNGEHD